MTMTIRTKSPLYDSHGRRLSLADKLAQGGEGAVYDLQGQDELVAKIYHGGISREKAEKLALMVNVRTERLLKLAAWPVDTLFDRPKGVMVGFLMPKVKAHKDVHILYGVKSRLSEFPEARWPFLIQTAANIARAFKVIHEHKHVIGDVNHGSIGVSTRATVTLFDCDSFQVSALSHQYLCTVGIDTHTPPELQGRSFRGVVRSTNHDAFGLAVIVFQLLFLGRHPFAGKFLGAKETPPLQKLISEYRFAYGPGARSRLMEQPTGTIPLESVSSAAAALFERAFAQGPVRPSPDEWIGALEGLASNLAQCRANAGHHYLNSSSSCPWCTVEGMSGVLVFTPIYAVGVIQDGTFNLAWMWAQIEAVPAPGNPPPLPERSKFNLKRSTDASKMRTRQFLRSLLTGTALLATSTILFLAPLSISATVWVILIVGAGAIAVARGGKQEARQKFEYTRLETVRRWSDVKQKWDAQTSPRSFDENRGQLESRKTEYVGLPALRLKRLNELERNLRQRQLQKFLDRHRIAVAGISGIGPSRQATLRSFGIETAADIDQRSLWQVPGFGPVYTSKLVGWRHSIEQRFVFNPALGVDPADKNAVEKAIADARSTIERELRSGASHLRQIAHQITNARSALRPTVEAALKNLAQAELDAEDTTSAALLLAPVFIAIAASLIAMAPLKAKLGTQRTSQPSQEIAVPRALPTPSTKPTPTTAQLREEAQRYFAEGVQLTKTRHYQEAASVYQQAIDLNPELAEAHHELGFALYKIGKYKESIAASQQAIKLQPDDAGTHRNLGLAYSALQQWKEAVAAFNQALKISSSDATTYYQLGLAYKNNDDLEAAIDAFQKAVKVRPELAPAHYELGLAYLEFDQLELAEEQYNILKELNPKLANKLLEGIEAPTPER
jgi:DNA-binding helix-hairpin-helix protein with protein kinase domain/Flp pilus assembly protein TadD